MLEKNQCRSYSKQKEVLDLRCFSMAVSAGDCFVIELLCISGCVGEHYIRHTFIYVWVWSLLSVGRAVGKNLLVNVCVWVACLYNIPTLYIAHKQLFTCKCTISAWVQSKPEELDQNWIPSLGKHVLVNAIYVHEPSIALQVGWVLTWYDWCGAVRTFKGLDQRVCSGNAVSVHRGGQESFSGTGLLLVRYNDSEMLNGFCLLPNICIKLTVRSFLATGIARMKSMRKTPNHYKHQNKPSTKANSHHPVMALVNILHHVPTLLSLIYDERLFLARCF